VLVDQLDQLAEPRADHHHVGRGRRERQPLRCVLVAGIWFEGVVAQLRFVNADPIGFDGGLNWYAYCGNDPISYADPFGLERKIFDAGWLERFVVYGSRTAVEAVKQAASDTGAVFEVFVGRPMALADNAYQHVLDMAGGDPLLHRGLEMAPTVTAIWGGEFLAALRSQLTMFRAAAGESTAARTLAAPAHAFERTHGLSGNVSTRNVQDYMDSMRANGWQGDAISVFEHNGSKYILDGHHRVQAAMRVGVEVPYNSIPASQLSQFGYQTADDVIRAAAEAGPVKLRVR
jgi:hypothetical protein